MPRPEEFNKANVLQNAMVLFWKKGYEGTSMQDLVDATGLNRSSIYNSFGSKLALYQETLKEYQQQNSSIFQRALVRATNPLEAIRYVFESFLPEVAKKECERGCFLMNSKAEMANKEEDVRKWLLGHQEQSLSFFSDLILSGQEEGFINSDRKAEDLAYFIFTSFQGYRMTGILVKDPKILKEIINNTLSVLN